jgi:AcrR family transcriptional regulator
VEEIAEAAEVSPSTFFRYFPTKEDVVLRDDYDKRMIEAFKAQPPELTPLQAFRATVRETLGSLTPEETAEEAERWAIARSVPELRATLLDELLRTIQMMADLVAERVGRRPNDPAVLAFAGALIGVVISTMLDGSDGAPMPQAGQIDAALALLEAGLPL